MRPESGHASVVSSLPEDPTARPPFPTRGSPRTEHSGWDFPSRGPHASSQCVLPLCAVLAQPRAGSPAFRERPEKVTQRRVHGWRNARKRETGEGAGASSLIPSAAHPRRLRPAPLAPYGADPGNPAPAGEGSAAAAVPRSCATETRAPAGGGSPLGSQEPGLPATPFSPFFPSPLGSRSGSWSLDDAGRKVYSPRSQPWKGPTAENDPGFPPLLPGSEHFCQA